MNVCAFVFAYHLGLRVGRWQPTSRGWRWQKCYELAYFQIAPPTGSIRSARITLQYHLDQCVAIFGIENMTPSTDAINKQFGGPTPKEANTFYSNGSDDPWQRAAVNAVSCCAVIPWLVGWLVGWLVDWLVGWLVGPLVACAVCAWCEDDCMVCGGAPLVICPRRRCLIVSPSTLLCVTAVVTAATSSRTPTLQKCSTSANCSRSICRSGFRRGYPVTVKPKFER